MTSAITVASLSAPVAGSVQEKFVAATSFEAQIAIFVAELQRLENAYNTANAANPSFTPIERVSVEPAFDTNEVTMSLDLIIAGDAVTRPVAESVLAHIPA